MIDAGTGKTLSDIEKAIQTISEAVEEIENVSQAGFWEAGLKLMGLSMKKVPVDTGNLRASAYVRSASRTKKLDKGSDDPEDIMPSDEVAKPGVEMGYYAHYAGPVHEMVGQKLKGKPRENFGVTSDGQAFGGGTGKGTYWDMGEPKFLESVVIPNVQNVIDIIRKRTEMALKKKLEREASK